MPRLPRPLISVLLAIGLSLTVIGVMEALLASKGIHANGADTAERWANLRARADALGESALVIIGASRAQHDIDLDVLRHTTGMEPIQLAISGMPSEPVLADLAADPQFKGVVLVDLMFKNAGRLDFSAHEQPVRYVQAFRSRAAISWNSDTIERHLTQSLHDHLRLFADGGTPMFALTDRLLGDNGQQFLVDTPDRQQLADYRLVPQPRTSRKRALAWLPATVRPRQTNLEAPDFEASLRQTIAQLPPDDNANFLKSINQLQTWIKAIEARGGRVLFVLLPTSDLIREIESRRFPAADYRIPLEAGLATTVISDERYPALRGFTCPDGSHLDQRDRARYTQQLARVLLDTGMLSRNSDQARH